MPKKKPRRRRGDGNVTVAKRDAAGRPVLWKASISLGTVTIAGKGRRNRPTEYAKTEPEAYQKLKRLQAQHLSGDEMTPSTQTVESFLLRWLEHVKAVNSPGTYAIYESRCRVHIIPTIGGIKLRALRTGHVQTMLDALATKGLASSTVRDIRAIVIKALNDARLWGDLKRTAPNPAADTTIRPPVEKRPPSLTEAQFDRLLEVISGHPIEPLILVALGTGARISECLGLLWGNIDTDAQALHITGAIKRRKRAQPEPGARYELVREPFTKTRDQRSMPLPAPVADVFETHQQRQQQQRQDAGKAWEMNGLIFTDDHGRPLDPSKVTKQFKALAKRAGLPLDFVFHSLRHSAATFLIKQGESQRTVAQVLGHRNIRTTQRYGEVLSEVVHDALDKHAQRLTRRRGVK